MLQTLDLQLVLILIIQYQVKKMIRHATKYDIPKLIQMVNGYASEFPFALANDPQWFDEEYLSSLLMTIIAGCGFVLIDDDERGFLAAIIVPNVWNPKILELSELAWWVHPEHRNSTIGGKLWIEFDRHANKLKDEGRIKFIKTSLTVKSPAVNFEKRGYKLLEIAYIKD